ncbi:MAG: HEPN domain-containing protein [Chloroflexota bacterium]
MRRAFLDKAEECLRGADREFGDGRYNNCANRCYFACFQAAVYALLLAGDIPTNDRAMLGHDFVQARFVGHLINRRKVYPASLRDVLARNLVHRHIADYSVNGVTGTQAARAPARTRLFLDAIRAVGGDGKW